MAILSSPILTQAAVPLTDAAAIDARMTQIFALGSLASYPDGVRQNRDFSAGTTALIAHWVRVRPKGEGDDLACTRRSGRMRP
jgi:hypothetical protein